MKRKNENSGEIEYFCDVCNEQIKSMSVLATACSVCGKHACKNHMKFYVYGNDGYGLNGLFICEQCINDPIDPVIAFLGSYHEQERLRRVMRANEEYMKEIVKEINEVDKQ